MQAKSANHVLSLDVSLTQKLLWLKDLLWFDSFALDDKESIHDTLNIVQGFGYGYSLALVMVIA